MRAPRTRRLAVAGGVTLALLGSLAGCGEREEVKFRKQEFRPLEKKAEQEKATLAALLRNVQLGDRRDARAVRRQIDAFAATLKELAELSPPSSVISTYTLYNRANARFVASLRRFAELLAGRNERALNRAAGRAQSAAGAVQRARNALDERLR